MRARLPRVLKIGMNSIFSLFSFTHRFAGRHAVWKSTPEATTVQKEIDEIHANGRSRPPVDAAFHGEFATSWFNQVQLLLRRGFRADWRSPSYVLAKMALCMLLGLFIGVRLHSVL